MIRIKEFRESLGLSQKQLADALGLDRTTVNKWESGNNMPTVATLSKIAAFFDVTTDQLLGHTDMNAGNNTVRLRECREMSGLSQRDVAKALKFVFDEKCVYRYGGDEFLIIRKGDKASFEKCLATLQSSLDDFETMDIHITYSAGYKGSVCHNEADLDHVIREADALLYQAKKHGKGKTVSE